MPDKETIELNLSKLIPAEKWRIIRLLTKIEEFPNFVSCVKEATVINKKHNIILSRWKVLVDGILINWIEEDTLSFSENTIYFKAIEGDLAEFQGKWTFHEHPEGTEIKVQVHIKVGIPAIKEFAETYIAELIRKNFLAILDGLEHRLISTKYARLKNGDSEKVAGFGIIGHLYNYHHLEKNLKILKPEFKMPSLEFIGPLYHSTPSFKLCDIKNFKSKTGQTTDGCFVVATFIPDMIEKDMWLVFSKVVKSCRIAEKHGVGIVALGGFTSIVAEKIGHQVAEEVEVPVTTGNTFTAAMTIEGILKAVNLLNLDITQAQLTIVGGTGDIGSGCARVLVEKVKHLVITGKTKTNLSLIGKELSQRKKAKITVTTDNQKAVSNADIVIAAASASAAILKTEWFKPGAIICDIGYPKNISYAPVNREDIFIFSGGLTKPPMPIYFPIDVGLPSVDTLYGCFAESIILAFEKRYENFSFGRGHITPDKIEEIRKMGEKHGFQVSDFYWGEKLIDAEIINRIRKIITGRK